MRLLPLLFLACGSGTAPVANTKDASHRARQAGAGPPDRLPGLVVLSCHHRKLAERRLATDHRRMQERRQHRSDDPSKALELLLEAHRAQLNARALVVATPSGQLLAGAGHDPGAVAAMIAEKMREGTDPTLATWRLRAGDRELVIGSLGGRLNHEVGDGVRRICPGT